MLIKRKSVTAFSMLTLGLGLLNGVALAQAGATQNAPAAQQMISQASTELPAAALGDADSSKLFEIFLEERLSQGAKDTPSVREAVRTDLLSQITLAREAKRLGLDKDERLRAIVASVELRQLSQAYFSQFIEAHEVSDAQLRENYERIVKSLGSQQVKLRQVVVKDEELAKKLVADFDSGVAFPVIASQHSHSNLPRNGDMGWINLTHLTEPLQRAVSPLKPGEVTRAPIKSDHGWHLLWVEDIRPFTPPTFESVKPNLELKAHQEAFDKHVKELLAKNAMR